MTRRVVLVTGATGLIGWPTMPQFSALGFQVIGLARHGMPGCIAADLLDPARVRAVLAEVRPTHILHLAWDVTPGHFTHGPENLDYVAATMGLARAAAAAGVQRFVGVGTCAEYDWRDGGAKPRREHDPTVPQTIYGIAKHATHLLIEAFFRNEGISFAWARPFFLFGPGESPSRLVAAVIEALRHERIFVCRHGQLVRDYMATVDASAALARLVSSDVAGPVNVGSGEAISLGELVQFVAERLGRNGLVDVREEPADGQPLAMLADVARLRDEVGFTPGASVRERLAALVADLAGEMADH